jgi:hypothetical protein
MQPTDFDGLWGAGRLRARRFDTTGTDGPAWWGSSSVCVPHGQTAEVPLHIDENDDPVEVFAQEDYIHIVTYMYDPFFHDHYTQEIPEIEIELQACDGSCLTYATGDSADNKQMIFEPTQQSGFHLAGTTLKLLLTGVDVGGGDRGDGCGDDSVRVYWAALVESNDRDDVPTCVVMEAM